MDNVDVIDEATDNFGPHARVFFRGDKVPYCKLDENTYNELKETLQKVKNDQGPNNHSRLD